LQPSQLVSRFTEKLDKKAYGFTVDQSLSFVLCALAFHLVFRLIGFCVVLCYWGCLAFIGLVTCLPAFIFAVFWRAFIACIFRSYAFLRVWEKFSLIQTFFWNFAWIRGSFLMLFDVCGLLILV
jgi:hypothetical protein